MMQLSAVGGAPHARMVSYAATAIPTTQPGGVKEVLCLC